MRTLSIKGNINPTLKPKRKPKQKIKIKKTLKLETATSRRGLWKERIEAAPSSTPCPDEESMSTNKKHDDRSAVGNTAERQHSTAHAPAFSTARRRSIALPAAGPTKAKLKHFRSPRRDFGMSAETGRSRFMVDRALTKSGFAVGRNSPQILASQGVGGSSAANAVNKNRGAAHGQA